MHHIVKCPYCGRKLREHERYCDFCEEDISKAVSGSQKPSSMPKIKLPEIRLKKGAKQEMNITAYCVKCNKKVNVKNPQQYFMRSKRLAIKGACPFCSRKVFRIIGMKK